jgi:hypothetical protein
MKFYLYGLVIVFTSIYASANDLPASQWKLSNQTLYDLTQQSYAIVSVTDNTTQAVFGSIGETSYYLQKGSSVYKCYESHTHDTKKLTSSSSFMCWELIKPYHN